MLYYFYLTRNITGLILVLSPLAGLLYIDLTFTLSMAFICGIFLGIPLGLYFSGIINFKVWTSAAGVLACAGAFFCAGGAESPAAACLAGLAAGGLALNLPPSIVIVWFRASKTRLLALVWTLSLSLGAVYGTLMERNTYLFLGLSLLSTLAGTLFFLEEPVLFSGSFAAALAEPAAGRHHGFLKTMCFFAVIGFTASLSCFTMPADVPFDFFISPELLFFAGLAAGPAASGIITDTKSVYSGAVFMIFLAEIAAAGAAHGQEFILLLYLGQLACGMLVSGLLVILPLLTFYLSDRDSFPMKLCRNFAACCAGSLIAIPLACDTALISGNVMTPIVFLLLILSFFMIFSAWKHRLFLLKGGRI